MDYNILEEIRKYREPKYDWGEIYYGFCTISQKGYVGQAQKFTDGTREHGTNVRWTGHIREAENGLDTSIYLNNAIRKYGKENFIVIKIAEAPMEQINELETYYIRILRTLHPYGYNLTGGGRSNWKVSDDTRKKLSLACKGKSKSQQARINSSISQLGKRFESRIGRKHPEDICLPKYISALRENDKLIGYSVSSFPIGINTKQMAPKRTFQNTANPKEAYNKAIKHLDELKKKYAHVEQEIKKMQEENIQKKLAEKKKKELPQYISPIYTNKSITGYKVSGVPDSKGNPYPEKTFSLPSGNFASLYSAKSHIRYLEITRKNETFVEDPNILAKYETPDERNNLYKVSKLPMYIRYTPSNSDKRGYVVVFPLNGKEVTRSYRHWNKTMEEKYNLAVNYLKQLYIKHKPKPTVSPPVTSAQH
jgi:group I intron endonuclease